MLPVFLENINLFNRSACVVQWLDHLGAVPCALERDARSVPQVRSSIRATAQQGTSAYEKVIVWK